MRSFFEDIFEYHHFFNQKIINQLIELGDNLPARTNANLSHVLNSHQIWNARILMLPQFGVHDLHSYENALLIDRKNYSDTMHILETADLNQPVQYTTTKGGEYSNTVRDILFHVANHSTHHKGQIIADIRQARFDPVVTDYIIYKRQ